MSDSQKFVLPALPYGAADLAPTISSDTVDLHYGKHHQAYFNMLNNFADGTKFIDMELDQVVVESFQDGHKKVFNNAGQAWNHILYWEQMAPGGSNSPQGKLLEKINEAFGDFDTFKTDFTQQAVGVFGSGWAWLVEKDGKLELRGLPNAENPLAHGEHALMGIDVWEHAYYLDYKNVRPDYVKAVLDNLINWDFVADRLG
ncbi:MAG: superoxide dismutase [Candidatus Neomarinimicrobiota bacterium]|nr:superoxide dismutase [Candidatus Neomarinimicrobiota bacterium]